MFRFQLPCVQRSAWRSPPGAREIERFSMRRLITLLAFFERELHRRQHLRKFVNKIQRFPGVKSVAMQRHTRAEAANRRIGLEVYGGWLHACSCAMREENFGALTPGSCSYVRWRKLFGRNSNR